MIAFICPTYGHFDYARVAIESFLDSTPYRKVAMVIDDFSPDWRNNFNFDLDLNSTIEFRRFKTRGGLTRSWNKGLELARERGDKYTIVGNSDLKFTPGWFPPIQHALKKYALVGPVTNGPGDNRDQNVVKYLPNYKVQSCADSEEFLGKVAQRLRDDYGGRTIDTEVANGFCMIAKTEMWWKHAFDSQHVFDPDERFQMVQNEHEFQKRMHDGGGKSGIVLDSFVFHYRSVSRGLPEDPDGYVNAGNYRLEE